MPEIPTAVFGLMSDAVICESGGKITYMNPAASRYLPKVSPGDGLEAVFPPENTDGEGEYAFSSEDGLNVSVCPTEGGRVFIFTLPDDGGEVKELCSRLGRALRESASVFQMTFGLVSPRLEELRDRQLETYAAMAERSCYSVLRAAMNISRLGELEADEKRGGERVFDLVSLCGDIRDTVSRLVGKKSAKIVFETKESSVPVSGDPRLIEEAVLNLLSNSLKYTPEDGEIDISVSKKGERAVIRVVDTGRGIPPEIMNSVFTRYGEKTPLDDPKTGLGLGIAVVRQIAVVHGGSVIVGNRKEGGASVSILLPIARMPDRFHSGETAYGGIQPILTALSEVLPTECYTPKYLD